MKTFEVLVTAFATVVVEAETEENALEIACDALFMGDMQMDEGSVKRELKTPEEMESAKRHADTFLPYQG